MVGEREVIKSKYCFKVFDAWCVLDKEQIVAAIFLFI